MSEPKIQIQKQGSQQDQGGDNDQDQKEPLIETEKQKQKVLEKQKSIDHTDKNKKREIKESIRQKSIQKIEVQQIEQDNEDKSEKLENQNQEVQDKRQIKQQQQNDEKEGVNEINYGSQVNYLQILFDHYCKMTYALGKSPTFDEIKKKSHIMTINKFMIFSKDFKLKGAFQVHELTYFFKNNASYYREMKFQQFIKTLKNISQKIYQQEQQQARWEMLMRYFGIENQVAFKKTMNRMKISFRLKGEKAPKSSSYKFKYFPYNGKVEEQVIQQVHQLREIRQLKKQLIINKHKENRINKIDELYQNGVNPKYKHPLSYERKVQNSDRNRYNKCPFLTFREERHQTYQKIHDMKQSIEKYDKLGRKLNILQKSRVNPIISEARKCLNPLQTIKPSNASDVNQKQSKVFFKEIETQRSEDRQLETILQNEINFLSKSIYRNTRTILPITKSSNVMNRVYPQEGKLSSLIMQDEVDDLLQQHLEQQRLYHTKYQTDLL